MTTTTAFGGYFALTMKHYEQHPEWRLGQTMFNTLNDIRPDLASTVRATDCDPFHFSRWDDPNVINFLNFIQSQWD